MAGQRVGPYRAGGTRAGPYRAGGTRAHPHSCSPPSSSMSDSSCSDSDSYCSDSDFEYEEETPKKRQKKSVTKKSPKTKFARPTVRQLNNNAAEDAKRLGIDEAALKRVLNVAKMAINPGTEAEGKNAERVLAKSLIKYSLQRVDIEKLMKPALMEDLLRESGQFSVILGSKNSAWQSSLAHAIGQLFTTVGNYILHDYSSVSFVFYGEIDTANTRARVEPHGSGASTRCFSLSVVVHCAKARNQRAGNAAAAVRGDFRGGFGSWSGRGR